MKRANVRVLKASSKGGVWVGTNAGLLYWDHESDVLDSFNQLDGSSMSDGINALHEDDDGQLLVATGATGLYRLLPGSAGLQSVDGKDQQGRELATMSIVGMLRDSKQRLWIDTPSGLYLANSKVNGELALTNISEKLGFGGRPMGANLQEDQSGKIWTPSFFFDPDNVIMKPLQRADGIDIGTSWFRSFLSVP